jgi:hypothetical protein
MLKYIREVNDLHLDFDKSIGHALWVPAKLETDKETVFIVAGDIATGPMRQHVRDWMRNRAEQFHSVIFVVGNHDLWIGQMPHDIDDHREWFKEQGINNVHILEKNSVVIDGVKFLGGILWTDFNNECSRTLAYHRHYMQRDYEYINTVKAVDGYNLIQAGPKAGCHWQLGEHKITKKFIFDNAKKEDGVRKIVVVTHMGPSFRSIDPMYAHETLANGFYVSNLDVEIDKAEIDYWFHGHTHASADYTIGSCRVINNARGYNPRHLNEKFDDKILFPL